MESVSAQDTALLDALKRLHREYGDFLQVTHTCGVHYDPGRFRMETEQLPEGYAGQDGEIFVAQVEGVAAACVAYRRVSEQLCEMKRLYVTPAFRGQGLARRMTLWLLERVTRRGFKRVILDTDVAGMPEAHALYRSLGFREYGQPDGSITFFELELAPEA